MYAGQRKKLSKIFGLISIGLIIGLFYGLVVSIYYINSHDYLNNKFYNISLFVFQSNITRYSLVFALIAVIAYLFFRVISRISEIKLFNSFLHDTKRSKAIIFLLHLSFLYAIICSIFVFDILLSIKILAVNDLFKFISSNPITVFRILISVYMISSVFLLIFITYLCSRFKLITVTNEKLSNFMSFRLTKIAGGSVLVMLILFNLVMFSYSAINRPDTPNVILITIDTLRADRLSSYGYQRNTSPNIDSLAEKGILFENAYSQSSWTYPSMASMHTALYPVHFGLMKFENRISDKSLTIAEHLKNNFYATFAVVSNIVASEIFGFGQGFDKFEDTYTSKADVTTSKITTEKAIEYIEKNKNNSFFVWIHYMDPHGDYLDHEEFNYASTYQGTIPSKVSTVYLNRNKDTLSTDDLDYVNNLYDEEISYTDKYIGKLLDSLNDLEIDDNTIIILTSDHGEELMERDRFGHGTTLYQEVIRVPLIVYNPLEPKLYGKRVTNNVEVRYIAKTILDLTNTNSVSVDGYNLYEYDNKNFFNGIVYSELLAQKKSIYLNEWKLLTDKEPNSYELYNLKQDPLERNNQFNSNSLDIVELRDLLGAKLSNHENLQQTEVDKLILGKEDIEKLKALGYLQ
ncbi:MAG: sulfatase-like hydrolase/transferase [Thermodesulfobacteriota bacterium]